jgi:hypothetical protein
VTTSIYRENTRRLHGLSGATLTQINPLLQQSWAKESLVAKILPPTTSEEPDAKLIVWDIVLIQG